MKREFCYIGIRDSVTRKIKDWSVYMENEVLFFPIFEGSHTSADMLLDGVCDSRKYWI
jgi:hypothetical protein